MLASMFNLEHRLTELRPSADERRLARLRDAVSARAWTSRSPGDAVRERPSPGRIGRRAPGAAA